MLSLFDLVAVLVTATAAFSWLNRRTLHLPTNIGLLVMGLGASLALIGVDFLLPRLDLLGNVAATVAQIDFYDTVMNGMLAFLLFAGALHVDLTALRARASVIGLLASLGVVTSMVIVSTGLWLAARLAGLDLPLTWAFVFGALIAPTDPVAVMATLKSVNVSPRLKTDMTGEALFNDGIAVVIFAITVEVALGSEGALTVSHVGELLVWEAGGGALLGLATGFLAYRAFHAIDDYSIEIIISLALVTGTYSLAGHLHMSGPIAVVVAGLLIGNQGVAYAMSERTRQYVQGFWTVVDDVLNAILFLLIGLEVLVVNFDPHYFPVAAVAIPLMLIARLAAVSGPILAIQPWKEFTRGSIPVLTWGGVRGGISIALALSLPDSPSRSLLLTATYAVVLFSIIVQGLSLGWVIRKTADLEEGTR